MRRAAFRFAVVNLGNLNPFEGKAFTRLFLYQCVHFLLHCRISPVC